MQEHMKVFSVSAHFSPHFPLNFPLLEAIRDFLNSVQNLILILLKLRETRIALHGIKLEEDLGK